MINSFFLLANFHLISKHSKRILHIVCHLRYCQRRKQKDILRNTGIGIGVYSAAVGCWCDVLHISKAQGKYICFWSNNQPATEVPLPNLERIYGGYMLLEFTHSFLFLPFFLEVEEINLYIIISWKTIFYGLQFSRKH